MWTCVVYTCLTSSLCFPLLSCSDWNTASHSRGAFLFGHGFLHSLFEMMKSSETAKDWMATGWARTHMSGCCCWSMWWDIYRIAQLMKPCGPVIKTGPVLPPSGDWVQQLFLSVYALQTWRASRICATQEKLMESSCSRIQLFVFLLKDAEDGREVVCTLHHIHVYNVEK